MSMAATSAQHHNGTKQVPLTTGLLQIAKEYGIFAAMAGFFIWHGAQRETNLNARLERQQDYINMQLMDTIKGNTKIISEATQALEAVADQANRNARKIREVEREIDSDNERSAALETGTQ